MGLQHLRRECLARTPLKADQCHVLPLPFGRSLVHHSTFDSASASPKPHLALQLPKSTWLVGTVGRLDPGKGQQTALRALARLPDRVHWLFVGDNTLNNGIDERAALEALARELGLTDRVHFR